MPYSGVLFSDVLDVILTYAMLFLIVVIAYPLLNKELVDTVAVGT